MAEIIDIAISEESNDQIKADVANALKELNQAQKHLLAIPEILDGLGDLEEVEKAVIISNKVYDKIEESINAIQGILKIEAFEA